MWGSSQTTGVSQHAAHQMNRQPHWTVPILENALRIHSCILLQERCGKGFSLAPPITRRDSMQRDSTNRNSPKCNSLKREHEARRLYFTVLLWCRRTRTPEARRGLEPCTAAARAATSSPRSANSSSICSKRASSHSFLRGSPSCNFQTCQRSTALANHARFLGSQSGSLTT